MYNFLAKTSFWIKKKTTIYYLAGIKTNESMVKLSFFITAAKSHVMEIFSLFKSL